MSCKIRAYESVDTGWCSGEMVLTAYVGPVGSRARVQFTIGDKYCSLSEKAVIDLIRTLSHRLLEEDGYTATGSEREDIIFDEVKT